MILHHTRTGHAPVFLYQKNCNDMLAHMYHIAYRICIDMKYVIRYGV